MVVFQCFEDGIEVNGATVHAILDGLGPDKYKGYKILKIENLEPLIPDEEHWYPQHNWLKVFKWICENLGYETLFHIGTQIPDNALMPYKVSTPEDALKRIDFAYHKNHRNKKGEVLWDPNRTPEMLEGIGHYKYEKHPNLKNAAIMTCDNPYPCDFDMGLIYGFIMPYVKVVQITHLNEFGCRKDKKSNFCKYLVKWKPK